MSSSEAHANMITFFVLFLSLDFHELWCTHLITDVKQHWSKLVLGWSSRLGMGCDLKLVSVAILS